MGGPVLRIALVAGGMMSGFGMFNALVMSYSRLPLAMAQDGMLPKVFGKLHPKSRAPWVAILALAVGWGLALNLGFERLVTLDIMIYGASLALEFVGADLPADSRAGIETAVPRSGRAVWSDCRGHSSSFASGICHYSQRT
jgi:amino acid transporter